MKLRLIKFQMFVLLVGSAVGCFAQRSYTYSPIIAPYDVADLIWISDDGRTGYGAGLSASQLGVQCFTYQDGAINPLVTPGQTCQPLAANGGNFVFKLASLDGSNATQLVVSKNGQSSILPLPSGTSLYPSATSVVSVNTSGQIAATLLCSGPAGNIPCAYSISTSGVFTRLPDLGGYAYATAINSSGVIAGWVNPPGTTSASGSVVVWSPGGVMKNISTFTTAQLGLPAAINAGGQIVGPGYFYDGDSRIVPIQLSAAGSISPISINDSGEVVGSYRAKADDGIDRPFYFANGNAMDLNGAVANLPGNKFLSFVWYINNSGQILVTALDIAQPVAGIANGIASKQLLLTPTNPLTAPVISGVFNSGSFAPGTSSGTWISIQGVNLSTSTRQWTNSDFANGSLPTSLDGVSVTMNGVPAYPSYVSPGQINALTPDDPATGPVQVQVINSKGMSNSFTVTKSDVMPAFFPIAVKYVSANHANGTPVGPASLGPNYSPARPGETIQLFGTGFGPANPSISAGREITDPVPLANPVTVKVNNLPAQVTFAGKSGSGLDQINIVVPASIADGDAQVQATVNGVTTPANLYVNVKF
jgi:uncharacterized protein (TIGR03437 family)